MVTETQVAVQPVSITVSLEELLVVLETLGATTLQGLDSAAWLALSGAERDVALSVARRALTARGLAQNDERGQLLIHRALLMAVGVCAYTERTAFLDHWPTPDVQPLRVFIYRRGPTSVVHVPADGLQHFHLLQSEAELAEFLSTTYGWSGTSAGRELRMSRDEFSRACEASAAGDRTAATRILGAANTGDGVSSFVETLSAAPTVSILQTISSSSSLLSSVRSAESEDVFTVVQSGNDGWLIAPVSAGAGTPLRATTATLERLRGRLRDVLWAGS